MTNPQIVSESVDKALDHLEKLKSSIDNEIIKEAEADKVRIEKANKIQDESAKWTKECAALLNVIGYKYNTLTFYGLVQDGSYTIEEYLQDLDVDALYHFIGTKVEVLKQLAVYAYKQVKLRPERHKIK